jgi:hypothetical protein
VIIGGLIALITVKIVKPKMEATKQANDKLIKNAENLYKSEKAKNTDLSKGPCLGLANDDYVVDTVHVPRTADDDKVENQCESYTLKQANHFIELNLANGELVRIK